MRPLGVGVVGLGFMGRQHALNTVHLARRGASCRLAAICSTGVRTSDDLLRSASAGNIGDASRAWPADVMPRIAPTIEDLLRDRDVDLVVVCTPTPSHVEIAIAALEASKHVLVEKPVALSAAAIEPLRRCSAARPRQHCMPAHVMRFWPGWTEVGAWIRERRFGGLRALTLRRLASAPAWNPSFYGDLAQSGGALVDLHVHDVDCLLDWLGTPRRVDAVGDALHVTGGYKFELGPAHVTAEAAWDLQPGAGFRMQCLAVFESATAEYDSDRDPPLRLVEGTEIRTIESSRGDGYERELAALLSAIAEDGPTPVTIEDAVRAARVIDQERDILHRREEDAR